MSPPAKMFPIKVNFGTISKSAEVTENGAAFVLKSILLAIQQCVKKEVAVKLNLKLGLIKINSLGTLVFQS
jgi:hypothetical protein